MFIDLVDVIDAAMNAIRALPLPALLGLAAMFGLLIGSFLNVVILRLPVMMDRAERQYVWQSHPSTSEHPLPTDLQGEYGLSKPGSHCPNCKAKVRWWMNVPVFSFIALKARCAGCGVAISWQYPIVECLSAAAAWVSVWVYGATATALAVTVLLWALLALTVIDLRTYLLPDAIVLPLMWLGLLVNSGGKLTTLSSAVWGAALGYLSLWSIFHLFKWITGKEGMGYGDFKLLAALGAWLGVGMILPIILFASFTGALVGGVMILSKRLQPENPIAFGPYLAIGGVLALFYGERTVQWYLNLVRL